MNIEDNTIPQTAAEPTTARVITPNAVPVLATPTPATQSPAVAPVAAAPASAPPAASLVERLAPRTNNQIKASAMADGIAAKAKWKTLIAEAKTAWPKIPQEELAMVDGHFQKLAGLVQLRQRTSREDSDLQVKSFFDKHYPAAGSVARPR